MASLAKTPEEEAFFEEYGWYPDGGIGKISELSTWVTHTPLPTQLEAFRAASGAAAGGAGGGSSSSWKKSGPLPSQADAFRAASTASGGAGGSSAPYGLPLPSQEAAFAAFKRYEATIPREGPLPATPAPPTIIRMHSARQHKPSSIITATASSPAAAAAAGLPEDHPLTAAEEAEADRLDAEAAAAEAAEKAAAAPASEPFRVTKLREALATAAAAGKKLPERVVMVICHGGLVEMVHRGNIFLPQCYAESTDVDMNAVTGGLIVAAGTPGSVLTIPAAKEIMAFIKKTNAVPIEKLQQVFPPLVFPKITMESRPASNVAAPTNEGLAKSAAAPYATSIAFVDPDTNKKFGVNFQPASMRYGAGLKTELEKIGKPGQKVVFSTPLESFTINCSRIIPPTAGELSPYSTKILNYRLSGYNAAHDPPDVKDIIGIYVLNADKWIKIEDLSELEPKPVPAISNSMTTDGMIERMINSYSWNGHGDPFTLRLVMQHCGSILSANATMQNFYRENSHLVITNIPKLAVYRSNPGVLLAMLTNLIAPVVGHYGGSRRASKTKRRKSKHYAKYSRKNRRNAGRV